MPVREIARRNHSYKNRPEREQIRKCAPPQRSKKRPARHRFFRIYFFTQSPTKQRMCKCIHVVNYSRFRQVMKITKVILTFLPASFVSIPLHAHVLMHRSRVIQNISTQPVDGFWCNEHRILGCCARADVFPNHWSNQHKTFCPRIVTSKQKTCRQCSMLIIFPNEMRGIPKRARRSDGHR